MATPTRRPTLLPRWLVPAAAVVGLVVIGVLLVLANYGVREQVSVPSLAGLEVPVARSRLAQQGLLLVAGDTRFSSDIPMGSVIEQDPPAGSEIDAGSEIVVVVSAGSDTFAMPDIVGENVLVVRSQLEPRGVIVEVETVVSEEMEGTVLETLPAAGAEIGTGSIVRLTVAGDVQGDVLLPGDLSGEIVLIDPAPPLEDRPDVTMEITRHLRALLEASGAEVVVTRSIVETQAPASVRAAWAAESSATVAIGIGHGNVEGGVREVRSLPSDPQYASVYLASVDYARDVVSLLTDAGERVQLGLPTEDPVLVATGAIGARVLIGDPELPENVEVFSDPTWVDTFSSTLYRAIVDLATE